MTDPQTQCSAKAPESHARPAQAVGQAFSREMEERLREAALLDALAAERQRAEQAEKDKLMHMRQWVSYEKALKRASDENEELEQERDSLRAQVTQLQAAIRLCLDSARLISRVPDRPGERPQEGPVECRMSQEAYQHAWELASAPAAAGGEETP